MAKLIHCQLRIRHELSFKADDDSVVCLIDLMLAHILISEIAMSAARVKTYLTSHESTPVLDLPQLVERCMGDLAFAERCLTKFRQQLNADVERLEESVQAGDSFEAARIAHLIKGAAATVAASPLAETASAVENAARQGYSRDADLLTATTNLVEEVRRFTNAAPTFTKNT